MFNLTGLFDGSPPPPLGGCTIQWSLTGPTSDSAGFLTLNGGSIPRNWPVQYYASGYSQAEGAIWFAPGQPLTVAASGDTVPAFGPRTVTSPPFVPLLSPAITGGAATIPASQDLQLTWCGGQSGATMMLTLAGGGDPDALYPTLTCAWDAALGQGTIAQALLTQAQGFPEYALIYGQANTTSFVAGGYAVSVSAMMYGAATVTFE
jgi:hypothetical protein